MATRSTGSCGWHQAGEAIDANALLRRPRSDPKKHRHALALSPSAGPCSAVLMRNLKARPQVADLFGKKGRAWLAATEAGQAQG